MIGLILTSLAIYMFWGDKAKYISILIVFFLVTEGFQFIPAELLIFPQFGIVRPYDWLLVFCLVILCLKPGVFINRNFNNQYSFVKVYFIFLILMLLYNIAFLKIDLIVIAKVIRTYLYFIIIFPLITLKVKDFQKIFVVLIYATSFASLLYILQPIFGYSILQMASEVSFNQGDGLIRFYNLPYLLIPVLFYLLSTNNVLQIKCNYLLLALNTASIFLSQHRNLILAAILCYGIYIIIINRFKIGNIILFIFLGSIMLFIFDNIFDNRISKGLDDLSEVNFNMTFSSIQATPVSEITTSEFRLYHFLERYYYIKNDLSEYFLGIGLINEDSKTAELLPFHIGLEDEYGQIFQVYTDDIAWSMILLHLGLFGLLMSFYFYFSLLKMFYAHMIDSLSIVALIYIVMLFFTSFYGSTLIMPYSILMLMFFASYCFVSIRTK